MLKCKLCDFQTESQISFSKHTSFIHKLKFPEYLTQIKYKGIKPICGCGCGKETIYNRKYADFNQFIRGHQSRLEGHWGDLNDPKRVEAIKNTRKEKFASGEYDHILEQVSKKRTQKTKKKISKSTKGILKPKPKGFGIGRKHSKVTKEKMSNTAIENIIKTDRNHTSKLEITFQNILEILEIKYEKFLYAKDIKAFYDFYIPEKNLVIEVDGDFWHCNPNSKHAIPKYNSQKKNIIRDKEKEKWLKDNGYKLLRFWETDINKNILKVKKTLLENCK